MLLPVNYESVRAREHTSNWAGIARINFIRTIGRAK